MMTKESGRREMLSSMNDRTCVCVQVMVALMVMMLVVVLLEVGGIVVLVIVVRVSHIGVVEVDYGGVVDIWLLGEVFMMEAVENLELVVRVVVGCFVRLVLWCVNGKGYFLGRFSLKTVEMNGLSLGGFLFVIVIWVDCFVLIEYGFLGKMVGADLLMDVVDEVFVVEAVEVVQAVFFIFL